MSPATSHFAPVNVDRLLPKDHPAALLAPELAVIGAVPKTFERNTNLVGQMLMEGAMLAIATIGSTARVVIRGMDMAIVAILPAEYVIHRIPEVRRHAA